MSARPPDAKTAIPPRLEARDKAALKAWNKSLSDRARSFRRAGFGGLSDVSRAPARKRELDDLLSERKSTADCRQATTPSQRAQTAAAWDLWREQAACGSGWFGRAVACAHAVRDQAQVAVATSSAGLPAANRQTSRRTRARSLSLAAGLKAKPRVGSSGADDSALARAVRRRSRCEDRGAGADLD